jgi:starch-binding outer membrane protein, SusD/RagB family
MKRITMILSVVLLTVGFESCTDWLDIRPESETVLEDYWKSESQATAVLASCYRGLTLDANIERMLVWGELRSDNVVDGNSTAPDMLKVLAVNITPTNSYASWASFYQVINYCNTFLHFAPGVINSDQNFTTTKLHTLESEALTIRALCYFYLVRTFQEVPLVLEPSINDSQNYYIAKSSERVILDQIIADLLTAQKYARTDFGKGAYNKGRVSLNTVNALLADVYLWDQQYENCVETCTKVIEDKTLTLVDGDKMLNQVFYAGNSTESIFELQFDKDIQNNDVVNWFYGYDGKSGAGLGELSCPVYLVKQRDGTYPTTSPFSFPASGVKESVKDIRETNFYGTAPNGAGFSIYKYQLIQAVENSEGVVTPQYRSVASTVNWILYRLSDVMLMKAEALVQLDRSNEDLKEALKMVNKTYLRSNLTADSLLFDNYSDKANLEKLVLRERQRELLFEGKRWFDLMRLVRRTNNPTAVLAYISPKLTGDAMSKNKMSVMDALYMPIFKPELEANPALTQNPFYLDTNQSN